MRSTSEVSVWWPTPADPYRHFSAEQIEASEQYFRPLRRGAAIGLASRFAGLVLATVAGSSLSRSDLLSSQGFAIRVLIGVGLTLVALRLPAIAVDGWFEYRHQLTIDGYRPVPKRHFGRVLAILNLGYGVVFAAGAFAWYSLAKRTTLWPAIVGLGLIVVAAVSVARQFGVIGQVDSRERELPADMAEELYKVAERFGLPNLGFRSIAANTQPSARFIDATLSGDGRVAGLNAYSVGLGPNRRVIVNDVLLAEAKETRAFIIGHELAHQAKHHLAIQGAVTIGLYLIGILGLASFTRWSQPWQLLGLDPTGDPLGLPLIVLFLCWVAGALGPVKSWLSRGHERIADSASAEALAPPTVQQSHRIHFSTEVDLVPPLWVRAYASHPTPPERLEFLARLRRST